MALGSEGTVRGAFDLDVGPAVRGVREYRREAAQADVQTRQLGEQIDRAFGPRQTEQIRHSREEMGGLAKTSRETRVTVRDQWKGMRREVEREAAGIVSTIATVRDRMRALGRERPSIQIDIDGVTRALAQVELLHDRLNALGRERATPRVALGGGFGGGGFGSAAARAAAGAGGGGGRRGGGVIDFGLSGVRPRNLAIGGALAYAQPLVGGATSLVSSAGAAGLGAGVVGLGGLAPLAAGIAGVMAVAKPATESLKNVWKAQDAYNKVVRQHGRDSKEAAAAQKELNRLERIAGPGSGYAAQQARGFGADWRRLTAPARQQYFGLIGDVAGVGRRAAPMLARDAQTSMTAVRRSGTQFARFGAGTETQQTLGILSNTFARELPTAERSLENITLTMERLSRASLPYFHEANVWVERQTMGWRSSTRDIEHVRDEMRPLVQSAKDWARLTGDTFNLLKDIGSAARPSGDSLVVDLDRTIQRWDTWIRRHPRQVTGFFDDTANSVRHIASALTSVAKLLQQLATLVRPLGDEFSDLVNVAASLGLIGTPGAGAAVYGAYRGLRGRGGGGAGMAGAAAGFMPMMGMGAARARGGVVAGEGAVFGGAAAGRQARAGGLMFGSGFRYGAPMSMTQRPGMFARAGALGRSAAGGALRGAGPIVLGMGALNFASTPGTFTERAQGAASMLTFGLVGQPTTRAMARQQGADLASADIQNLGGAYNVRDIRGQIERLRAARGRYAARSQVAGGGGLFGGHGFAGAFDPGRGGDAGPTQEEARRNAARVETYTRRIRELRQAEEDLHRQRGRELDDLSRQRATQYGAGLQKTFNVYRRGGDTPAQAADATVTQIRDRLAKTRNAGVETLGEASLAWARELRRRNPALKKAVDDVTSDIEDRFRRMGRRVTIVNGDILTGSRSEWRQIRDAMSDPVEQARENISSDLTAIQQQAVGSLRSMGFSPGRAKALVAAMEKGGATGRAASQITKNAQAGVAGPVPGEGKVFGAKKERGGLISGSGLMDTVPFGGAMTAPGEAYIANRHTLARLSMATRAAYGLTAEQVIRGETRPHWAPGRHFALGGGMARSGALAGVNAAVAQIADAAIAANPGLTVTSTTGGKHAKNSLHYRGAAVDLAGGDMNAAAAWIGRHYGRRLTEGIHNPNLSVHDGQTVPPSFWGATTWAGHADHIHVGLLGGGGARGAAGLLAGGGGGAARHLRLHGRGMRQPGVPGVLRQRAGDIYARGLQTQLNRALDTAGGGGDLGGFHGGGDAAANMALGRRMMLAAGFGADEWPALKRLWTRESGWRASARNPSSGAFGIPQSLPASKMGPEAVAGDAAAQIRWGLGYIRGRYGSPSGAWAHEQAQGWYSRGGRMKWAGAFDRGGSFVTDGPTHFVAGEGPRNRRERVSITPAHFGGGGITFGPGSVVVQVGGKLSEAEAEKVGRLVVTKIIEAIDRGKSQGVIG